jgi:hypothetical protein
MLLRNTLAKDSIKKRTGYNPKPNTERYAMLLAGKEAKEPN